MFKVLMIFIFISTVIARISELANPNKNEKEEAYKDDMVSGFLKRLEKFAEGLDENPNKKRLQIIDEVSGLKEDLANISSEEINEGLEEKLQDKVGPMVSSDMNIEMRGGRDSLEGMSLEQNDAKEVCLINENKGEENENSLGKIKDQAIEFGEKHLDLKDISHDELVRGFVFSEIIGKPVSMR